MGTNNVHPDDLSIGLLDLLQLSIRSVSNGDPCLDSMLFGAPQEIPESRLGNDLIGREDAHAVYLGIGLTLRGEMTTDDLIFDEAHLDGGIELAMTSRYDNAIHRISRKSRQGQYEKYDGSVL